MRRTTLRGTLNLTKRHLAAVLVYDLSLLMRHLTGHGTPKQWLAAAAEAVLQLLRVIGRQLSVRMAQNARSASPHGSPCLVAA